MEFTMSVAPTTYRAHRPRRLAVLTALRWNLIPLGVIVAAMLVAWTRSASTENWALLAMIVIALYGGGALVISAGLGAGFAAALMAEPPRRAAGTYGHSVTERSAVRRGSLAALLGWVLTVVGVVVVILVVQVLTHA
jgi:hypothetical protein